MKKFVVAAIAAFVPSVASAVTLPSCDADPLAQVDCAVNRDITLLKSKSSVDRNCSKVSYLISPITEGYATKLGVSAKSINLLSSQNSAAAGYCCIKVDTPKGPYVFTTDMLWLQQNTIFGAPSRLWLTSQIFNPMLSTSCR